MKRAVRKNGEGTCESACMEVCAVNNLRKTMRKYVPCERRNVSMRGAKKMFQ